MFDYPAEGTPPWGARRPASPADPVPPVKPHDPKVGERRPRSKQGQPACGNHTPAEQRRSRQLCRTHSPKIAVCGKVAARGRAASPTKRGRIVRCDKKLSPMVFLKGTNQAYRPCTPFRRSRTIGRPCSIARRRAFGWRRPCGRRPLSASSSLIEKCIPLLGIFYMCILRCIFFY
jgi:hypothetical protein